MKSPDIDANHYKKNSFSQYHLAEEALALHKFLGNEQVLDIGCGDGKLSKKIADKVPNGFVYGIDPSFSMINLAKATFKEENTCNLDFNIGSAETFKTEKQFDLITAFSSLHWVRGQKEALNNMVTALKPRGRMLILTFPTESPYDGVLKEVIHSKKWKEHSDSSACKYWITSDEYQQIASRLNLKKLFLRTYEEVAIYRDENHFMDYVKGWLPCLITLPENLQQDFLKDLASHARQCYGTVEQKEFKIPYYKIVMYLEK